MIASGLEKLLDAYICKNRHLNLNLKLHGSSYIIYHVPMTYIGTCVPDGSSTAWLSMELSGLEGWVIAIFLLDHCLGVLHKQIIAKHKYLLLIAAFEMQWAHFKII